MEEEEETKPANATANSVGRYEDDAGVDLRIAEFPLSPSNPASLPLDAELNQTRVQVKHVIPGDDTKDEPVWYSDVPPGSLAAASEASDHKFFQYSIYLLAASMFANFGMCQTHTHIHASE